MADHKDEETDDMNLDAEGEDEKNLIIHLKKLRYMAKIIKLFLYLFLQKKNV